ncbi:hypothetical protein [Sphaerisporangium dianthi]|uniref:Streptomyces killer toxin-like beta/gamma crystallin domain-containing protein n=1 Tax=Sphaerisporangium dianthi TaxID=1436120 RepID=A0ABV9CLM2_9ACTN
MKVRRILAGAFSVTAVAGTVALAAPMASASAARGCGGTAATVYNGSNVVFSASCTGDHYYTSSWSTRLVANGWSGAVYDTNNNPHYFCDWQTITLNVYTKEIYLNSSKPPRCQ